MRVHCEDWTLDTATRLIVRGGAAVHVSPKAFDLLTVLLLERPRAVSKAELLVRLWPDTIVSEANLTSLVSEVRSVLEDPARSPRYVRTVHRHGYAFCGSLTEEAPALSVAIHAADSVRLLQGEREIALAPGANVLGRLPDAGVWIHSAGVSRRHARVTVSQTGTSIEDLGSKNGTFLNGTRLSAAVPLSDGDEIQLGPVKLVFRVFLTPSTTETQPG